MDGRVTLMLELKLPHLCRAKSGRLHAESFNGRRPQALNVESFSRLSSESEAIGRGPSSSTWRTVAQVPIEQVLQDESLLAAAAGVSTS